ncbi:MAG: molybdate ABC transporter permease subunit [Planctomycetaceae bacterium]|nr:MAG: molybdate ABC transporter permease subunit [Planctomycetaceae bacterium]
MDWTALRLTLQLALWTTAILFVVGMPIACWLAETRSRARFLVEAVVSLPLVLPPTVLGFYLLWGLGPRSAIGELLQRLTGATLPFTFPGIVLASTLYNLPFAVRPFAAALSAVDRRYREAAWCLGVSRWQTFVRVTLPLAWRGILTGLVLTFAHTVGEFGVILMVGGNIPGVTRTLSMAVYDDVQALNYTSAGATALWLLFFSLIMLCIVQSLDRRGVTR